MGSSEAVPEAAGDNCWMAIVEESADAIKAANEDLILSGRLGCKKALVDGCLTRFGHHHVSGDSVLQSAESATGQHEQFQR